MLINKQKRVVTLRKICVHAKEFRGERVEIRVTQPKKASDRYYRKARATVKMH